MIAKPPEHLVIDRLDTPIGGALLAVDELGYVRAFDWEDYTPRMTPLLARFSGEVQSTTGPAPAAIRQAVLDYFDGDLEALKSVPWRSGGTEFQMKCWEALCAIPAGSVSSYAQQAVKIGNPSAVRAVGRANGCNPVGVIVPCHRVIGANGSLTGYGGGLTRKSWLLRHEGAAF